MQCTPFGACPARRRGAVGVTVAPATDTRVAHDLGAIAPGVYRGPFHRRQADAGASTGPGALAALDRLTTRRVRLATLEIVGEAVPGPGARVTREGADIGVVTSAASSPRFGVIALAILNRDGSRDGEKVEVAGNSATVRRVPTDDPKKLRPRADPRNPMIAAER